MSGRNDNKCCSVCKRNNVKINCIVDEYYCDICINLTVWYPKRGNFDISVLNELRKLKDEDCYKVITAILDNLMYDR